MPPAGGAGERPQRLVGGPAGGAGEQGRRRASILVAEELSSGRGHRWPPRARRTSGSTGGTNCQPGPRKNVPMTVSTTATASSPQNMTMATLRRRRDGGRVAVDVGEQHEGEHRTHRDEDAGDQRVEVGEQLLQPGEVPRCLGRLRRQVGVGQARAAGAANATPSASTAAATPSATTTWRTSRWGQVNTVSSTAPLLGGDRLAVDDAEHPGAAAVEVGRAPWSGPRGAGAAVASSSNVPACATDDRSTAKPSLRTRQMWMQMVSTTATGSTATCRA